MIATNLDAVYREYIGSLNARRLDDLDRFVHDTLIYNERPMTRRDYRNLIGDAMAAIPDLHFEIGLLVTHENMGASRLNFHCTPTGAFMGLSPYGKAVSFSENVFYRFREGKISQVWSVIDKASLEDQLSR